MADLRLSSSRKRKGAHCWQNSCESKAVWRLRDRICYRAGYPHPAMHLLLTDVQCAYWLGVAIFRVGERGLSRISGARRDKSVDRGVLQTAWQRLVDRHDMLRRWCVTMDCNRFCLMCQKYEFEHLDLRGVDHATAQEQLEATRRRMSHQVLLANRWPLFELRTSELDGQTLLHLSLDLLTMDFFSVRILANEWLRLVLEPTARVAPLEVSFRDYVLAGGPQPDSASYREAEGYWRERLASLPPPPMLPLAKSPSAITRPHFAHRQAVLESALWQRLKDRARAPASRRQACSWPRLQGSWRLGAGNRTSLPYLTLFDRAPLHPQVNQLVGNFTTILLLEVHAGATESFEAVATRMASRLWHDLEHRQYSGIQLQQEMAKRSDRWTSMPVVFTSALAQTMPGMDSVEGSGGGPGNLIYSVGQTPQVCLEHQTYEQGEHLHLSWNAVDELFPADLLDDMFETYCGYLRRLGQHETAWSEKNASLVPPAQLAQRAAINDTAASVPADLLHAPFLNRWRPLQTVVVTATPPQLPGCVPARPAVGPAVAADGRRPEPLGGGRDGEGLGAGGRRARRPGGRRGISAGGFGSPAGAPLATAAARRGGHRPDTVMARATAGMAGGGPMLAGRSRGWRARS